MKLIQDRKWRILIICQLFLISAIVIWMAGAERDDDKTVSQQEPATYSVAVSPELDKTASLKEDKPRPQRADEDQPYQSSGEEQTKNTPHTLSVSDYLSQTAFGNLPQALRGTALPTLYTDLQGHLVTNNSVRQAIEYFLASAESTGQQQALGRAQEYFDLALPEPASNEARELLNKYLQVRNDTEAFSPSQAALQDSQQYIAELDAANQSRKQLRRQVLGQDTASALFGDQEKLDDYTVASIRITLDSTLDEQGKSQRLSELEESLPANVRQRVRHQRLEKELLSKIASLRKADDGSGQSEQQIYQLRKEFYGEQVADKWAFLEDRSADWEARVSAFQETRKSIESSVILNDAQKRQQVNALRDESFSADEKLKLAYQILKKSS